MVGDPGLELYIDESLLQGRKFKVTFNCAVTIIDLCVYVDLVCKITVEGNIASGKTTLLDCFKDKSYAEVMLLAFVSIGCHVCCCE